MQFSCAVARCEHYAGLNVLDRDSSVWHLHKHLRLKQHYSAGTLKAILANAVTTAVGFRRAKACQSSICPFCDLNLDETLEHIFDHCPAWASLRPRCNAQEHAALPSHTRLTSLLLLRFSRCRCRTLFAMLLVCLALLMFLLKRGPMAFSSSTLMVLVSIRTHTSPGSSFFCPFCWSDAELLRLGICCPSRSSPELRVRSLPFAMLEMDIFSTALISMACACSFPRLSLSLAVSDAALASSATMPSLGM